MAKSAYNPTYFQFPGQKEWRMCHMKRKFDSERQALSHNRQRAYRCPICKKWHLTTSPKKGKR
jgi:hypothetical protein